MFQTWGKPALLVLKFICLSLLLAPLRDTSLTLWPLEKQLWLREYRHTDLLLTSHTLPLHRPKKQGGDTQGGTQMNPACSPWVQAVGVRSAAGRVEELCKLRALCCSFPHFFAHTLLCADYTWISLAALWHQKTQFTSFGKLEGWGGGLGAPEIHRFPKAL